MNGYSLISAAPSCEQQTVAAEFSRSLAAGEWEETLRDFTERYPYRDLLAWIVNFPLDEAPESQRCLNDMRRWIAKPDEDLRRQIFTQAQTIGFSHVVGALGLSLFWSQGSMTAVELEPVYPQLHLSGLMLLCALKLLCSELAADDTLPQGAHRLLSHWFGQQSQSQQRSMSWDNLPLA